MNDSWSDADYYERFMGRWSLLVTQRFLAWLDVPYGRRWLDVGCGTGALTRLILKTYQPKEIVSVDASQEFITHAQQSITSPTVQFKVGLAQSLELGASSVDVVVSGLTLNFEPQPEIAVSEMLRVAIPGGTIGVFLWDYSDGMEMLRYFWDAAVELDKGAEQFDEGSRFPLCREGQLESLVRDAGLNQVEATPIEVNTVFKSFTDYWTPFLSEVGPAPGYVMSLSQQDRRELEGKLRERLPVENDGTISLSARAWAVKGVA